MKNKKRIGLAVLVLSVLLAVSICLCGCSNVIGDGTGDTGTTPLPDNYTVEVVTGNTSTETNFTAVVARSRVSVGTIYCYNDSVLSYAMGSGVIYGKSEENKYYFVTNYHVVEDWYNFQLDLFEATSAEAAGVVATDDDGEDKTFSVYATFIGADRATDLAVLEFTTDKTVKAATLAENSKNAAIGEDIFQVGNPLGIGITVSKGMLSTKSRTAYLSEQGYMHLYGGDYAGYSGCSGGPVFNANGEILGIHNSSATDEALNYDITITTENLENFIPSNTVKATVNSMLETYNTDSIIYGYAEGTTNIGLAPMGAYVYDSDGNMSYGCLIYDIYDGSDATGKVNTYLDQNYRRVSSGGGGMFGYYSSQYYFDVIEKMTVNDIEYDVVNDSSLYASDVYDILNSATIGSTVTLTLREAYYTSSNGRSTKYYLDDETSTVEITATQYRYTPPTVVA